MRIQDIFRRLERALQIGSTGLATLVSSLFLVLGGGLALTLILLLPELLTALFSGDFRAGKIILMCAGGIAVMWLQWRWRHSVYPQLRKAKTGKGEQ